MKKAVEVILSDFYDPYDQAPIPADESQVAARDRLREFFNNNRERVFCSRQIEVQNEREHFHWITSRALRDLEDEGSIKSELRKLSTGAPIRLVWHKSHRFYRLAARQLVSLVNEYAAPNIGASLGLHGEMMVLEGFARKQFVMISRSANEYNDKKWQESNHNLDFIFERDGKAYGIEVKNTLGYMDRDEFVLKTRLSLALEITPVFVCRMLPKSWILNCHSSEVLL